ncbi:antitoxin [Streptomyces crystallinus]|uniref:Kanamycin biosynthetic protein n=1 Tax=Streptomyces crystallinus TaxID=68191 RepID=A0ABP3QLF6_9ACTN
MGILDRFKDQAQNKADDVIESVGDRVDEKTGDRFTGQVDQAQEVARNKAREALGTHAGTEAEAQGPATQDPATQPPAEQAAAEQRPAEQSSSARGPEDQPPA